MDNVIVDFPSAFDKVPKRYLITHKDKMDEIPGIFALMKPLPGAIEAFTELSNIFDTYILSTSPWENETAWSDKLTWVKNNLGAPAYKRLILSHHKNLNLGDYLVDDRLANGVDKFSGEHIHFGTEEFPDWNSVVSYLKSKK